MNIKRNGSQASGKGNTDWFTGTVRIDQPFQAEEPARVGGATVTFEPGAMAVSVTNSNRRVRTRTHGGVAGCVKKTRKRQCCTKDEGGPFGATL